MGESPSMVLTILNPNTIDVDSQAISIYGKVTYQADTDRYTTVYHLTDPSGSDDTVLRVTLYAGPNSEERA
jgi:hypothetical protein